MIKVGKVVILSMCAFMLVFMFLPIGQSDAEVLSGYQATLSFTNSGALQNNLINTLEAGDPWVEAVAAAVGESVGYVWCLADGTPVTGIYKTDTFPQRKGNSNLPDDHLGGDGKYHRGTDLVPVGVDYKTSTPVYQVALFDGVVKKIGINRSETGWGYYVVLDHGNNFYTLYAHLGYGGSDSHSVGAPSWQQSKIDTHSAYEFIQEGQEIKAGDIVGAIGTTGNSSGLHAHIEMFLAPLGYGDAFRARDYYYAGVDNLLRGGKSLDQLTWYNMLAGDAGSGIGSGGQGLYWDDFTAEEAE